LVRADKQVSHGELDGAVGTGLLWNKDQHANRSVGAALFNIEINRDSPRERVRVGSGFSSDNSWVKDYRHFFKTMAAASTNSRQGSSKITPEVLQEMLQFYNLSRREFINTYNIQPLVYIPELPYSAKTTFVIMYVVIFVLALAGNSLVIYIVLKKRAIQTATDIFICSLAVSDLLITFFCIPFTLLQNISSEWFGGENKDHQFS
ncbi:hypothetical protein ATANTOWER_017370, partial [Ataeniobius toweri]|nr:hypothetical protein [Ataeniobius toweri]